MLLYDGLIGEMKKAGHPALRICILHDSPVFVIPARITGMASRNLLKELLVNIVHRVVEVEVSGRCNQPRVIDYFLQLARLIVNHHES